MTTTFKSVKEFNEAIAEKSKQLHGLWDEAGPELDVAKIKSLDGDSAARLNELKKLAAEINDLGKQRDDRQTIEEAAAKAAAWDHEYNDPVHGSQDNITGSTWRHPAGGTGADRRGPVKSFGQAFVESKAFTEFDGREGPKVELDYDLKTVFRTGAGWDSQDIRIPRVELDPQRPIRVVDNVPMLPTSQAAIVYMEETTFTNNAVETAESTATTGSDLIGEAALALTQRTKPVEWLPVFIPVTMQQMEDVEGAEAYVEQRLQYMLRQRLDSQILQGDGSTPNIEGRRT